MKNPKPAKCGADQFYIFKSSGFDCVDKCPAPFVEKKKGSLKFCDVPHAKATLSDNLYANRGKRRQSKSGVDLKRGSAIHKFPARVLDKSVDPPRFKKDENGNFLIDEKACKEAAEGMKKFGKAKAYGVFSMWANAQPNGSKAKDAFTKCRDWAYCVYQSDAFDKFKAEKLREKKAPATDAQKARIDTQIENKASAINKKYPKCV